MIKVTDMESFPAGENPYWHDEMRMGMFLGTNVLIMFEKSSDNEKQPYIIVVNTETGERIRVTFDDTAHTLG